MKAHRIGFSIITFTFLVILLYAANAPFVNYDVYFNGSNGRPYQDITGLSMAGKEFSEIYLSIFIVFTLGVIATISRSLVTTIVPFVGTVSVAFYLAFFADDIYATAYSIEGVDKIRTADGGTYFLIIILIFAFVLFINMLINIIRVANKPVSFQGAGSIDSETDLLDF